MNTAQLKATQTALGLTNSSMAQLIGVSLPQYERYRAGHAIPLPVSRLLLLATKSPSTLRQLKSLALLPIENKSGSQGKSRSVTSVPSGGCGGVCDD